MESPPERKPRIRRANNFIVEENLDLIQWPHECSNCGRPAEVYDNIHLQRNFKNIGVVKSTVADIPYCNSCFGKIKATKRLDKAIWVLAFVFGIPLGLLLAGLMAKQRGTQFICIGLMVLVSVALMFGFFYLVIRFPIKSIFKNRYVEYVDAWYIEEQKPNKQTVLEVVINIPNKVFADKFAALNGALTASGK